MPVELRIEGSKLNRHTFQVNGKSIRIVDNSLSMAVQRLSKELPVDLSGFEISSVQTLKYGKFKSFNVFAGSPRDWS